MPIILVGHGKGGVGKTFLATNFAAIATEQSIPTILMDTDVQGSSCEWNKLRTLNEITPNVNVLALPENSLHAIVELAKSNLIMIDIGANSYQTMLQYVLIADLVLIPVGPDPLEMSETVKVIKSLKTLDMRHKDGKIPAFLIFNNLGVNVRSTEDAEMREYFRPDGITIFDSVLRQRKSVQKSRKGGLAVTELTGKNRDRKAEQEMFAVFNEANHRIMEVKGAVK